MPLLPRSLKWRTILLTLLGLIAVGVSGWWTFRADITAYIKQQQTLNALRNSPHAFERDVGSGELRVGIPVDEWAAAHPPRIRLKFDEYETLRYDATPRRDNLTVIAVNGRIVFAGTHIDRPKQALVGGLSPDESAAYTASMRRWADRSMVGRAVVGGIAGSGSQDRWKFPTPLTDDLTEQP